MATNLNLYDTYREDVFDAQAFDHEGSSAVFYCVLVKSGYSPNQNTHRFFSAVGANEITGGNYTSGGHVLSAPAITLAGAGTVTFDVEDPTVWSQTAGGFASADRAIIAIDPNGDTTQAQWRLLAYSDSFGAKGNSAGDFTITINANGVFQSTR